MLLNDANTQLLLGEQHRAADWDAALEDARHFRAEMVNARFFDIDTNDILDFCDDPELLNCLRRIVFNPEDTVAVHRVRQLLLDACDRTYGDDLVRERAESLAGVS